MHFDDVDRMRARYGFQYPLNTIYPNFFTRNKMADEADMAQESIELAMRCSLAYRKPVSTKCEECGDAATVLPNGARARFCDECLVEFQAGAR